MQHHRPKASEKKQWVKGAFRGFGSFGSARQIDSGRVDRKDGPTPPCELTKPADMTYIFDNDIYNYMLYKGKSLPISFVGMRYHWAVNALTGAAETRLAHASAVSGSSKYMRGDLPMASIWATVTTVMLEASKMATISSWLAPVAVIWSTSRTPRR
jgi:hypothetical protein